MPFAIGINFLLNKTRESLPCFSLYYQIYTRTDTHSILKSKLVFANVMSLSSLCIVAFATVQCFLFGVCLYALHTQEQQSSIVQAKHTHFAISFIDKCTYVRMLFTAFQKACNSKCKQISKFVACIVWQTKERINEWTNEQTYGQ